MKSRRIRDGIRWMGAVDWTRRIFDSLIPLPDGTSYNAYLVQGSDKTALLDTVEPTRQNVLMEQLRDVPRLDYLVSHHAEQDHSGSIPAVLEKYPEAVVLCSPKAQGMLVDHLGVPTERMRTMGDGETISLGDKTLQFLHVPWVHWPETMATHVPEARALFTCDLFGSHLATSVLYAREHPGVWEAAKRYYAEIMMPFRKVIRKNLAKLANLDVDIIGPSHGPLYDDPGFIMDAYRSWTSDDVANAVVIPYVSMHGSTERMVDYLLEALVDRDVRVEKFDLVSTDIGKLAMALVDPATIVIGTPAVLGGPHPLVFGATHLANALRPKLQYAAVIGSYGWGAKTVEQITGLIPNLSVEMLGAVLSKGFPGTETFEELDRLADTIGEKHAASGG